MNNTIIYRPYRSHVWFIFFTVPIGIFAFVAAGYCLQAPGANVIFFVVMGALSVWLTKALYDSSKTIIFFEPDGLWVSGVGCDNCRHILWEELSNAYYVRNFRGFLFVVLSTKALSPQEAKKLANRGANLSKICIDDVVVIHIDDLQNVSQIKELIDNHVLHVDIY